MNNLKQIGLAMHNYHSTYDVFPIGYVAQPNTNLNVTTPGWGWASAILPQLEQQPALQRGEPRPADRGPDQSHGPHHRPGHLHLPDRPLTSACSP